MPGLYSHETTLSSRVAAGSLTIAFTSQAGWEEQGKIKGHSSSLVQGAFHYSLVELSYVNVIAARESWEMYFYSIL